MSVTIKELVNVVATSAGITKVAAEKVIVDLFSSMTEAIKDGNDVTVRDFGRFYSKERPARAARNPKTGEAIRVEAKTIIKFVPRGVLK